ncbi:hypothetical protein HanPSC8_Chr03g0119551 [Helianthus annuus]|nr:hypothetical protein HanIR_Chr03g0134211 [Helianthus annuus]KAJ0944679.1 hypothetical protein HanPSC8_Chr03g0119551 [Helianthus annuus]
MGIGYQLLDGVGVDWGMFDMLWALALLDLLVWAGDIRGWQVIDPYRISAFFGGSFFSSSYLVATFSVLQPFLILFSRFKMTHYHILVFRSCDLLFLVFEFLCVLLIF